MTSWLKDIFLAALVAVVVGVLVWFFGSVIGGANVNVALFVRVAFFVMCGFSLLLRVLAVLWIFYHAYIRKVKYRDMSEAVRVYKMHKDPKFKDLREQAFLDVLARKRMVGSIAEAIVTGFLGSFSR